MGVICENYSKCKLIEGFGPFVCRHHFEHDYQNACDVSNCGWLKHILINDKSLKIKINYIAVCVDYNRLVRKEKLKRINEKL